MADLNIEIKGGMPDGDYHVVLRRDTDDSIQYNDTLSFVGGIAVAPLTTAINQDKITGSVVDNEVVTLKGATIYGLATSVADNVIYNLDNVVYGADNVIYGD